tara:strand:+ start:257 stop:397 length:141 start_codon:yes stop_codon:yes gene_type:complete
MRIIFGVSANYLPEENFFLTMADVSCWQGGPAASLFRGVLPYVGSV